jgi:hypothetical protein
VNLELNVKRTEKNFVKSKIHIIYTRCLMLLVITSKSLWIRLTGGTENIRNAYRIFVGKAEKTRKQRSMRSQVWKCSELNSFSIGTNDRLSDVSSETRAVISSSRKQLTLCVLMFHIYINTHRTKLWTLCYCSESVNLLFGKFRFREYWVEPIWMSKSNLLIYLSTAIG